MPKTQEPKLGTSRLLTTEQAASVLALSPRALEAWRLQGRGPRYVKLSRAVRYRPEDLASWIESGLRQSTSERGSGQS